MSSDLQTLFVNLAEKERVKGHHSPEGRAIRVLSRALNGWMAKNLSGEDVLALCEQALEDWLKTRLKLSAWATLDASRLGAMAAAQGLITDSDEAQLKRIASARFRPPDEIPREQVEGALEFCIYLVEKHW
jgi:hypothetical protein